MNFCNFNLCDRVKCPHLRRIDLHAVSQEMLNEQHYPVRTTYDSVGHCEARVSVEFLSEGERDMLAEQMRDRWVPMAMCVVGGAPSFTVNLECPYRLEQTLSL